jgi:pyridoxamine 5'-phosphate oxidase family protein
MSKFTDIKLEYLQTQRLGRLATVKKNGEPQIAPVTFRCDAELDAIDIGGLNMGETQKYRNVAHNGLASFVIDDVLPPFQPRGIEIRGHAQALPDGGQCIPPAIHLCVAYPPAGSAQHRSYGKCTTCG